MMLLLTLLVVNAGVVNSQYSRNVTKLFTDLQSQAGMSSDCVTEAEHKMEQFPQYDENKKYAVGLINIYTQNCKVAGGKFYAILNKNIRSGNPGTIWKRTEDLLNDGIQRLGLSRFPLLYRGCKNTFQFQKGTSYRFHHFISTSTITSVAQSFLPKVDPVFFTIRNALGVSVSAYSPFNEHEVLLKSLSSFKVLNVEMHNGIKMVELQYTGELPSVNEASFCDSDYTSTGVAHPATIFLLFSAIFFQLIKAICF